MQVLPSWSHLLQFLSLQSTHFPSLGNLPSGQVLVQSPLIRKKLAEHLVQVEASLHSSQLSSHDSQNLPLTNVFLGQVSTHLLWKSKWVGLHSRQALTFLASHLSQFLSVHFLHTPSTPTNPFSQLSVHFCLSLSKKGDLHLRQVSALLHSAQVPAQGSQTLLEFL